MRTKGLNVDSVAVYCVLCRVFLVVAVSTNVSLKVEFSSGHGMNV